MPKTQKKGQTGRVDGSGRRDNVNQSKFGKRIKRIQRNKWLRGGVAVEDWEVPGNDPGRAGERGA